eukprot:6205833-Pleurochrysis_carterae.AAC.3
MAAAGGLRPHKLHVRVHFANLLLPRVVAHGVLLAASGRRPVLVLVQYRQKEPLVPQARVVPRPALVAHSAHRVP